MDGSQGKALVTAWDYLPGPGNILLLGPIGFLICALRLDSDSEIPSSSRFPRLTLQFRRAGVLGQTEGTSVEGDRMLTYNMWPWLAVPVTNPQQGVVCLGS